jgi:adhesin HecA-like repeat protein
MATNRIFSPGYRLSVVCTNPATPVSGGPVRYGTRTGVAIQDEGDGGNDSTKTTVDFGPNVWDLVVDDDLGGGIAVGDPIWYNDTASGSPATNLSNKPAGSEAFFGYALETVSANATTLINVEHVPHGTPGLVKQTIVAGGAAGAFTITGLALNDRLISVLEIDATDSSETYADLSAEFSITAAATIDNTGGTATTGGALLVTYLDVSAQ